MNRNFLYCLNLTHLNTCLPFLEHWRIHPGHTGHSFIVTPVVSTSVVVSVTFSIFRGRKGWTAQYIIILHVRSILKSRFKILTNSSEPMETTTFQSKNSFSNEIQTYKVHIQDLQRNLTKYIHLGCYSKNQKLSFKKTPVLAFLHYTFLSHKTLHYFNLNKGECSIFWNVSIYLLGPSASSSENSMRYKILCLWLKHIQIQICIYIYKIQLDTYCR